MRVVASLLLLVSTGIGAAEINPARALFHYQMFCQGCHTPDGVGASAVPRMKDTIGYFLDFQQGREYLVRVPGSATSALGNAELAEVLNWIVLEFGNESVREPFTHFTASEVGALRKNPLNEVYKYRAELLGTIANMRINQSSQYEN